MEPACGNCEAYVSRTLHAPVFTHKQQQPETKWLVAAGCLQHQPSDLGEGDCGRAANPGVCTAQHMQHRSERPEQTVLEGLIEQLQRRDLLINRRMPIQPEQRRVAACSTLTVHPVAQGSAAV